MKSRVASLPLALRWLVAALFLVLPPSVRAQRSGPTLGIGFNTVLSAKQGLGIGFKVRAARAVNSDLSLAVGTGITGFVLAGRDDASYLFDPQFSAIVTVGSDRPDESAYLIGGVGAYIPIKDDYAGGPTIHGGMGWVRQLYETRLFYELNPQLIIGETAISIAIPFRIGVIF